MGYIAHEAVIVTYDDYIHTSSTFNGPVPDVEAFRASLPEEWRALVVGPVKSLMNGDTTWFFAPDGSKEGWSTSDDGDRYRQQFVDLFRWSYDDGSTPFNVIVVRYGDDAATEEPGGSRVTYSQPTPDRVALA